MKKYIYYFSFIVAFFVLLYSCKKTTDTKNPYDDINRNVPNNNTTKQQIDSNSITGLHTFIFATKCAIASCHGGPFEPDFRTPLSSYNTLVWQKIIKNNSKGSFTYRVIPGDTAMSWLHERLVTDDSILGRMPRYLPVLNANEMSHINKWIMDGAKDVNGVPAVKPNNNIQLSYFVAYDKVYTRLDTARASNNSPFQVNNNTDMRLYFYVTDDETKPFNFLDCKLKFSTSQYDFSNATSATPVCDTVLAPGYQFWYVSVNTNTFVSGKQIFMRYYGRDPDHTQVTEFPNNNSYYYQNYYSFIVK